MSRTRKLPVVSVSSFCLLCGRAEAAEVEAGYTPIFNGRNLDGWQGNDKLWSVQDGTITGQTTVENPTQGNTFLLWQAGTLDDFELRLQFRIVGGNSGIQYRSEHLGKYVVKGYQADLEAGDTWTGANYEERGRGVLARRGEKVLLDPKRQVVGKVGDPDKLQSLVNKEGWNDYTIIARGNHLVHKINGHVTSDVVDRDPQRARRSGILALQLHAGPPMKVQFKNIRLKRLPLADRKKIVLVAGHRSHGYAAHEFNAGCLLLKRCLDENVPGVLTSIYLRGWPKDPTAFDNADAVVLYMNGGGGHPVNNHLEEVDRLMKRGVGLACMHYAVEVPKGKPGNYFLDWIGGYFETFWSVNPHWKLSHTKLSPDHPVTRGVRPFAVNDEWYYHMRFRPEMKGVIPLLTAVPPENTRRPASSARGGNPAVAARKGQSETVAWAVQRADGGRGFGFTGGHVHWNWAQDDFRRLVLNALVWVAKAEVPAGGVKSKTPTLEELEANQDFPQPENFDRGALKKQLEAMRRPAVSAE